MILYKYLMNYDLKNYRKEITIFKKKIIINLIHIFKNYLKQTIDAIRNLLRKRCVQYVDIFSKSGDNTTSRSCIKEGQWSTHHNTQHHYMHLACSQPAAQLGCQIAEKTRHRYNIRHNLLSL